MDYIYLQAGRVRLGGTGVVGGQSQFDFFGQGGCGGFKTNLNKKVGESITYVRISFFSNGRV